MWLTTEELNFVGALPSQDVNGVTTAFPCLAVNMAKYSSMVAVVQMGLGSTYRLYMQYASTAAVTPGSTGNFCIGRARANGGSGATTPSTADLLTAYTALVTTGSSSVVVMTTTAATFTPLASSQNCAAYLEIKADDLPTGYPYVALVISTSAQAHPVSVTYVMKPRYPMNTMMPACT